MVSSTRATLRYTSGFLGTFQGKIWPGPKISKNIPKTAKIEGYNTRSVHFRGPSSDRHGIPPRAIRGHCKGVMWFGTNIWMHLRSVRGNFGFTRNEQMWCSEAFRGNTNGVKHPRNVTSHVGLPKNGSGENMTRLGEVQKCLKTTKIECYNTRFRNFLWHELRTPRDAS